jgi:hypothetical protein
MQLAPRYCEMLKRYRMHGMLLHRNVSSHQMVSFHRSLSFSPCVGRYNLHGAFFIEGCSKYGYLYDACIAQA